MTGAKAHTVNPTNLLAELKRRNVYRAAVAYGVVAWFLTQLTTQVFPFFEIPNSAVRFVVIALAVGFPIAMLLSWLYELTPEGIVRTGRSRFGTGEICSTRLRTDPRLHHNRGAAAGYCNVDCGATPVLQADWRGNLSEKTSRFLPFENLSEEKANAFFTEGVQDEILTNLSRIADLKVISRTSVMQYKTGAPRNLREIGQQLGVAHVVQGSVQRAANKVRVNAQLIHTRNDAHLWAQTYDRDLADVFAIQSEIAKAIADQLQAKLSPNEKKVIEQPPTTDLAAFDLYSRAKSLLLTEPFSATGDPHLRKAIELLDEAVKRDPSFFDAYCQLAYAHEQLYAVRGDDRPARAGPG